MHKIKETRFLLLFFDSFLSHNESELNRSLFIQFTIDGRGGRSNFFDVYVVCVCVCAFLSFINVCKKFHRIKQSNGAINRNCTFKLNMQLYAYIARDSSIFSLWVSVCKLIYRVDNAIDFIWLEWIFKPRTFFLHCHWFVQLQPIVLANDVWLHLKMRFWL